MMPRFKCTDCNFEFTDPGRKKCPGCGTVFQTKKKTGIIWKHDSPSGIISGKLHGRELFRIIKGKGFQKDKLLFPSLLIERYPMMEKEGIKMIFCRDMKEAKRKAQEMIDDFFTWITTGKAE